MTMNRLFLWLLAVTYAAFGLLFVLAPEVLAQAFTGASPQTPSGLIDMRATYGGLNLAAGVAMALCALRTGYLQAGIALGAIMTAGLAVGRSYGMLMDGQANSYMVIFLAIEIATIGIAGLLLRSSPETT
ncbi:MAG: hypothetical protein CMN28_15755 [Salinisphaeraceae bacterium]|nr:hypothetical protein [Salinisphaeraceae bacterium]